jgi:hypothetical protein
MPGRTSWLGARRFSAAGKGWACKARSETAPDWGGGGQAVLLHLSARLGRVGHTLLSAVGAAPPHEGVRQVIDLPAEEWTPGNAGFASAGSGVM